MTRPSAGSGAGNKPPCVLRGRGGGSADVPESRPACLPQVKHLIPAAPRLVSRVNSVRRSDQNNEGLCGRAPRGGREREPRTAVRGRDWAQAQEREPCADAALGDTHARRGRGGPSAHDAELRLRPHPPPCGGRSTHAHRGVSEFSGRGRPQGWGVGIGGPGRDSDASQGDGVPGALGCGEPWALASRSPEGSNVWPSHTPQQASSSSWYFLELKF